MFLAYVFKLKPNNKQALLMSSWLDMLRATYNFCLRDRIEAYEEVKLSRLGNYSFLALKAECCPLTCSVSKKSNLGYPWKKNGKSRSVYEQQSSELPILKKVRSLTEKLGLHFLEINPKNTSRQCNSCGHISQDNRDKEKFLCTQCGNFDDADINAAKNIVEIVSLPAFATP